MEFSTFFKKTTLNTPLMTRLRVNCFYRNIPSIFASNNTSAFQMLLHISYNFFFVYIICFAQRYQIKILRMAYKNGIYFRLNMSFYKKKVLRREVKYFQKFFLVRIVFPAREFEFAI